MQLRQAAHPAQHVLALAQEMMAGTPQSLLISTEQPRHLAQPTVVKLRIDLLKPHPSQHAFFSHLPEMQIELLARDMKEHGLQHPIEVLPDYTIIAGHFRVEAARRNKWSHIAAIIRYDLAARGELAVELYVIRDNYLRRQLSPLERAPRIADQGDTPASPVRRSPA